jgi:LysR family glycine cleavage system transcriptional activator
MIRRLPNLNQIRAFEVAARRMSFKDAAEELHVTHAAISHQIKALEADLGIQLFHRRTRRVELTSAGKKYAEKISGAIGDIAEATKSVVGEQMTGEITISMAPFLATRTILPYLPAFHKDHPGLVVNAEMSGDVVDLRKSEAAAAVRYGFGDWPGMTSILLYGSDLCPVAAPGYLGERSHIVSPAEIAEMTLAKNAELPDEWVQWFSIAGYLPSNSLNFISYSNQGHVVEMALSGNGVALADPRIVAADLKSGRLQILHSATLQSSKSVYLVFPKTEYPDARVSAFASWYCDFFASETVGLQKTAW